jgi:hypothetical protein
MRIKDIVSLHIKCFIVGYDLNVSCFDEIGDFKYYYGNLC